MTTESQSALWTLQDLLDLFDVPFATELLAFAHRQKSFSVRSLFPVPACRDCCEKQRQIAPHESAQ